MSDEAEIIDIMLRQRETARLCHETVKEWESRAQHRKVVLPPFVIFSAKCGPGHGRGFESRVGGSENNARR